MDNSNDQDNSNNFYYGEYQYQRKIDKWNFVVTTGAVGSYFNSKAQLFGDTTHTGTNICRLFSIR